MIERPGRFNVSGAIIATYLLATGSTGLELAGSPTWVPYAFDRITLILAVGLGVVQGRLGAPSAGATAACSEAIGRGGSIGN